MPWRQEPKKDVVSCEKPRRAANKYRPGDIRMGEPITSNVVISIAEKDRLLKASGRTETSKYPEEKKAKAIP